MRLIDADKLKEEVNKKKVVGRFNTLSLIDNAPTVELTEADIQKVLNKYCMTAVANEYLIALHNKNGKPKGKWLPRLHASENDIYICSCCAKELGYDLNFCPNCGADMRK